MSGSAGLAARIRRDPWLASLVIVGLTSIIALVLVYARGVYTGRVSYDFLHWNLFLAWIPLVLSYLAVISYRRTGRVALAVALGLGWLVFLPNAPYILTDLMHLRTTRGGPIWLDALMLIACAWAGTLAGIASLRMMHALVEAWTNRKAGWVFTLLTCGLAGYGVFLGRFERWNSWDILTNPGDVLSDALRNLAAPKALVFTVLMGAFFWVVYLTVSATSWRRPPPQAVRPPPPDIAR